MVTADQPQDNSKDVVQLLQQINSGLLDSRLLDKESRQSCLEALRLEGYTASQAASVLKVSEKTILRDLKQIRERNAFSPNIQFVRELVGEFIQKALSHHDYLTRLARSKEGSLSEKAQCEYTSWKVLKETVETLQALGYLPLKPREIAGELYHHIVTDEGGESIVEVRKMLSEIEAVAKDTDTYSEELGQEIKLLSMRLEKAEVAEETKKLMDKQKETIEKKEEENEK